MATGDVAITAALYRCGRRLAAYAGAMPRLSRIAFLRRTSYGGRAVPLVVVRDTLCLTRTRGRFFLVPAFCLPIDSRQQRSYRPRWRNGLNGARCVWHRLQPALLETCAAA